LAKKTQLDLNDSTIERITLNVRSMVDDRVERGIDLSRGMKCDSCGEEKPSAGSSLYGAYKLCNDCLLDLTIAIASAKVETVVDFMTNQVDVDSPPPTSLTEERDRHTIARSALHSRDKLLPSNEPV
jgi:myo-inositol-1-phosphate synthase